MVFGYLFLAETDPNLPTNPKSVSTFLSPLHSWSRVRRTNPYTYQWGEHIRTTNIGKLLLFMVFYWLKRIPIHQLTPNLCFNIAWFRLPFFGWNASQSTNQKSMFQHSFPPLHSWSRLRRTNRYTYRQGDHIRTLDIGKLLRFIAFFFFFGWNGSQSTN